MTVGVIAVLSEIVLKTITETKRDKVKDTNHERRHKLLRQISGPYQTRPKHSCFTLPTEPQLAG